VASTTNIKKRRKKQLKERGRQIVRRSFPTEQTPARPSRYQVIGGGKNTF